MLKYDKVYILPLCLFSQYSCNKLIHNNIHNNIIIIIF